MEKKGCTPDTLCSLSTHCSMPSGKSARQKVWPQIEFETILVPREAAKNNLQNPFLKPFGEELVYETTDDAWRSFRGALKSNKLN